MQPLHATRAPMRVAANADRNGMRTRVLIVEDEGDIAGLIRHTLERGGDMIVEVAASGDQALRLASEHPPDLVVLDLNLPVLGGLEVCRLLRSSAGHSPVPIIMLTARGPAKAIGSPGLTPVPTTTSPNLSACAS